MIARLTATLTTAALAALLSGCMTPGHRPGDLDPDRLAAERLEQTRIAFGSVITDYRRLQRVAFPLYVEAANLPGVPIRPSMGVFVGHSGLVRREAEAAVALGLDAHWTILEVFPESPAARAGLRGGDRVLAIDGVALPPPPRSTRGSGRSPIVDRLTVGQSATIQIERDGELLEIEVVPVGVADYRLAMRASMEVNAVATGRSIRVNRGCLRLLRDDDLAFVLAHELAHNALRHQRAVILNYLAGSVIDIAALGAGVFTGNAVGASAALYHSRGFEFEADAVGLLILHRAGYAIDDAPAIWRRLAAHYPGMRRRHWLPTHPSGPERVIAMEDFIQELKAGELGGGVSVRE